MRLRMFNIVTWMPGQDGCPETTPAFTRQDVRTFG
jgi:hypothetical protein